MKKLFLTFFIVTNLLPILAYAQTAQTTQTQTTPFCTSGICTYTPLEPLPGQQNAQATCAQANSGSKSGTPLPVGAGCLTFAQYIGNIFTISIVTGAMVAVAVLVFSGITYMMSEALPSKDWGKRKMKQALWALLILLGSYLILSTINPQLVTFGGIVTNPTNPLNNSPFIQQSANGTPASGSSLPSAAQINSLPACTTTLTYGANGAPTCQGF